jgi:hypothetical protein
VNSFSLFFLTCDDIICIIYAMLNLNGLTIASPAGRYQPWTTFAHNHSGKIAPLTFGRSPVCVQAGLARLIDINRTQIVGNDPK